MLFSYLETYPTGISRVFEEDAIVYIRMALFIHCCLKKRLAHKTYLKPRRHQKIRRKYYLNASKIMISWGGVENNYLYLSIHLISEIISFHSKKKIRKI